ncbi:hypothetical protein QBC44DRAFT_358183 [Cladorrhinum sp. PSN332]|nr:hypothetical protein QBC44DRAFT_358183 [Cladorrhinum sp. PSN332]
MPDCGAQCINSVGPANGCPTAGDVQCNCRNAKIIQSAAEACVLVSCGPITAISVQSAASAICDQCAAPSAAVQGDDIKVVEARPTWRQVLDPRPKPRPTQWRDILSPQPTWHQVIDPRRKPQITINRAAGAGVAAAPQPTNHNVVAARQATGTEKPGPDEIPCDLPECWGGLEVVEKQPEPEVDAVIPCLAPDCWA